MNKKILSVFLVAAMLTAIFATVTASAVYADIWTPNQKSSDSKTKSAVFSKDSSIKYGGEYSLKIQNLDYNDTWYSKTIALEKDTMYKISAMVKYEGYELQPDGDEPGGANVSLEGEWRVSEIYNKGEWKKIELEFNSGSRKSVTLCLRNGYYYAACKGTAWFSDVKIEKKDMNPSTNWSVLCLIYKNIDVTLKNFRRAKEYHYENSFDDKDVAEISSAVKQIKKTFGKISDNIMTVSDLSVIAVDAPVTSMTGKYNGGVCIEPEDIQATLDLYLSRKKYDQIIIVAPLGELAHGWDGLGGGFYKNLGYVQVSHIPGEKFGTDEFPDAVFVHEILHCIESRAKEIKNVAALHDAGKYRYSSDNDWIEWYGDYMKNALDDGKGLPQEAYHVYNGKYDIISSDMSANFDY